MMNRLFYCGRSARVCWGRSTPLCKMTDLSTACALFPSSRTRFPTVLVWKSTTTVSTRTRASGTILTLVGDLLMNLVGDCCLSVLTGCTEHVNVAGLGLWNVMSRKGVCCSRNYWCLHLLAFEPVGLPGTFREIVRP